MMSMFDECELIPIIVRVLDDYEVTTNNLLLNEFDRYSLAIDILHAIAKTQPDHIIELNEDGWCIQHSMMCRLEGNLFDCKFNQAAGNIAFNDDDPPIGKYICVLNNSMLELGEKL